MCRQVFIFTRNCVTFLLFLFVGLLVFSYFEWKWSIEAYETSKTKIDDDFLAQYRRVKRQQLIASLLFDFYSTPRMGDDFAHYTGKNG